MLRDTSRTLRVWHPRGPDKVAPPEVKRAFRLSGVRGFSPAGTFEQDDMDNWQECTQTCRGIMARRLPVNTDGARPRALRSGARRLGQRLRVSERNRLSSRPLGSAHEREKLVWSGGREAEWGDKP